MRGAAPDVAAADIDVPVRISVPCASDVTVVTPVYLSEGRPSSPGEEDRGGGRHHTVQREPTFYVGPNDIFPEEFLPFLGLRGTVRDVFLQAHGELLTARWWRGVQEKLRAGEIVDIFPYREEQRLHHAW